MAGRWAELIGYAARGAQETPLRSSVSFLHGRGDKCGLVLPMVLRVQIVKVYRYKLLALFTKRIRNVRAVGD